MIVHCITTPHNHERQRTIRNAWSGYTLEFHPSIDWRDFGCDGFERIWGLKCCLFGHASLWQKLGRLDPVGWHLVIEDDVAPLPSFRGAVAQAMERTEFEVIKLFHHYERPASGVFNLKPEEWISTAGYLIRQPGKVLDRLTHAAIDFQLSRIATVGAYFPRVMSRSGDSTLPARRAVVR